MTYEQSSRLVKTLTNTTLLLAGLGLGTIAAKITMLLV